ncbi:hypothetical protein AX15_003270 [Amanita polypyramis BW_CC]|nr:hypothetical protein AX15_003270 [Amanita polypyramis BW_CC]
MDPPSSRLVPGRHPQPGVSPVADLIRQRRGHRGLTPLDAVLLHVPPVAEGWNLLLGAVRTKGALPGDVRELMILRVAAINKAKFEWDQHEPVGRGAGLTTPQLYIIRDTSTPLPPAKGILTPLQTAALRFADASTRDVRVPKDVTDDLIHELRNLVKENRLESAVGEVERAEDLFVEAAAVAASYNMVSRFLVSTDVAGLSDSAASWGVHREEHFIPIPSEIDPTTHTHKIHVVTLTISPDAPWVVFANSLLTDLTMWNYVVPFFLQSKFNILLHSQRGHGQSTLPPASPSIRQTTIPSLAYDIAHLIHALQIRTPIHALIGVSQGGAATLAFTALPAFFPSTSLPSPLPTAKSIIACCTSVGTQAGNKSAWEERASLAYGAKISFEAYPPSSSASPSEPSLDNEYAAQLGMSKLASITIPRWFPTNSPLSSSSSTTQHPERASWVSSLIKHTPSRGFIAGAQALAGYDLLSESNLDSGILGTSFNTPEAPRVLLLAGSLDGGGKIGQGLRDLAERWANVREGIKYVEVEESGHLPVIDQPERWWSVVSEFLRNV